MSEPQLPEAAVGRPRDEHALAKLAEELARLNERLDALLDLLQDLRDLELAKTRAPGPS